MLSSHCLSTSAFPPPSPLEDDAYLERPARTSAPVPIGAHLEENTMGRSTSPLLSSSAESLCSVRSSCSTRSALEREADRREKRRLLDISIGKIQGAHQPLRRHLLVYNTVKALQRDLDCLDEEELYVSLMEPAVDAAMEVDHWLAISEQALAAPAAFDEAAEREADEAAAMLTEPIWSPWSLHIEDSERCLSRHQEGSSIVGKTSNTSGGTSWFGTSHPTNPSWDQQSSWALFSPAWSQPTQNQPAHPSSPSDDDVDAAGTTIGTTFTGFGGFGWSQWDHLLPAQA